jgi:hypothetical protein
MPSLPVPDAGNAGRDAVRAGRAAAGEGRVIRDRRTVVRRLVVRPSGVPGPGSRSGPACAGLPRPPPAGPRAGHSPGRREEGHQSAARSCSAWRPPGSGSRLSSAPAARRGPARRRHRAAARPGVTVTPRATDRAASAAYAPRASPARRAASDSSPYSASVSANRTVRLRLPWFRVRRRGRAPADWPSPRSSSSCRTSAMKGSPFPLPARRECAANFMP